MCIFSGAAEVSKTRIFARLDGRGSQYLAYQMQFGSDSAISMILPLPVSSHDSDTVEFISLEGYPQFFLDLYKSARRDPRMLCLASKPDTLEVVQVGMFEASFVPTLADFHRLDPRFTLPAQTWDKLPEYADYGFAVFKLRQPMQTDPLLPEWIEDSRARDILSRYAEPSTMEWREPHPMAFRFRTRRPNAIFFPTVHIHDGEVHPEDEFDHVLYLQGTKAGLSLQNELGGFSGSLPARHKVDVRRAKGLIDGNSVCHVAIINGVRKNEDIWLAA